jgi:hypothetical protein
LYVAKQQGRDRYVFNSPTWVNWTSVRHLSRAKHGSNGDIELTLYQFTKVWQHFCELKTKPSKGFKSTKWRSHFVLWYKGSAERSLYFL